MARHAAPRLPFEATRIKSHFETIRRMLYEQFCLVSRVTPSTTGTARELFVDKFLRDHLPSNLRLGSGLVKSENVGPATDNNGWSRQQDVIVHDRSAMGLPIGPFSLFYPEGIIACIDVKSQLSAAAMADSIAANISSLPAGCNLLRVLLTYELANRSQHRTKIIDNERVQGLKPEECPDLIVVLDNAPIIKSGSLRILGDNNTQFGPKGSLVKLGSYENDKWLGLALLVFELAQRSGGHDWRPYLHEVLPGIIVTGTG